MSTVNQRGNAASENQVIEPERYELFAGPAYRFRFGRRSFVKALGAGLMVVAGSAAQESGGGRGRANAAPAEISAWLHIAEDGTVTAFTGKVEVGQNARTSLTQVVADELRVPLASVRMVMGDTERTPFDAGTFGSRTSPAMAPQLRRMAAAARATLADRAAAQWTAEAAGLQAEGGRISDPRTGKSLSYGELTKGQKLTRAVTAAESVPVTPATGWKIAGADAHKVEATGFVTGAHKYTSDVARPGMLYGRMLRPPSFGTRLVSLDAAAAQAMPGVKVVHDGEFAGVAAPSAAAARKAAAALRAEWQQAPASPSNGASNANLDDLLKAGGGETRAGGGGRSGADVRGSVADGLAAADKRLRQTYRVAYIAHVPLEPRAAVAEWEGDKVTVWTGTQRPFGVRAEVAAALHVPESAVRVIVPDTGSGYGGKHTGEAAIEAARLARAAGRPVKLVWTREEEFTWAYFRPAGVIEVASGARSDGTLTAWEFHNYNSGGSAIGTLYAAPNRHIEFHAARSPLRQGSYRALAATANHFARETQMDEMAHALGLDPLAFRLKNLAADSSPPREPAGRLRAVFEAAAERFGWGRKPAAGRGFGIAGGSEKGSYIAACAEVAAEPGKPPRIVRVVAAFECGAIINPGHLRSQVEGGLVQGIGGALFERIEFENGRILNPRLSRYRVPRFSDTPKIETVLLDRKDLPTQGAGETPIVALAPAVGNAIFAATGQRLRSLPLQG